MKKLVLMVSLLAVHAFGGVLPIVRDIRLEVTTGPVMGNTQGSSSLIVYSDGSVAQVVRGGEAKFITTRQITTISNDKLDRINSLIEDVRGGKIVTPPQSGFHCFAISNFQTVYTADNGKVFLEKERVCLPLTINEATGTNELVGILNQLTQLAQK